MSDGQFFVDYMRGELTGVRDDNTASETVTYNVWASTTVSAGGTGDASAANQVLQLVDSAVIKSDTTDLTKALVGVIAAPPVITSFGNIPMNAVTGADNALLAAQGANTQIWVMGYSFTVDTDGTTVSFQDEDDNVVCAYTEGFKEFGGIAYPIVGNYSQPYFTVATNKAFEVDVAVGTIGGIVHYCVADVS